MMTKINWEQLALQIESIKDDPILGKHERGGNDVARNALELILGKEFIQDAVDYYVKGGKGTELVLSILRLLRSVSAMNRCYEIYQAEGNTERGRALELLAQIADYHALVWVAEFLEHPDEDVNVLSIWILDNLLLKYELDQPEMFRLMLEKAEQHTSQRVRSQLADLSVQERFEALSLESNS
jgi:hypothetical protein